MNTRTLTPAARKTVLARTVAHVVYGDNDDIRRTGAPKNVAAIEEVNGCCYVATLRDGGRARLIERHDVLFSYVQEALAAGHTVTAFGERISSAWSDACGWWVGYPNQTRGAIHGGILDGLAAQAAAALGREVTIA